MDLQYVADAYYAVNDVRSYALKDEHGVSEMLKQGR